MRRRDVTRLPSTTCLRNLEIRILGARPFSGKSRMRWATGNRPLRQQIAPGTPAPAGRPIPRISRPAFDRSPLRNSQRRRRRPRHREVARPPTSCRRNPEIPISGFLELPGKSKCRSSARNRPLCEQIAPGASAQAARPGPQFSDSVFGRNPLQNGRRRPVRPVTGIPGMRIPGIPGIRIPGIPASPNSWNPSPNSWNPNSRNSPISTGGKLQSRRSFRNQPLCEQIAPKIPALAGPRGLPGFGPQF